MSSRFAFAGAAVACVILIAAGPGPLRAVAALILLLGLPGLAITRFLVRPGGGSNPMELIFHAVTLSIAVTSLCALVVVTVGVPLSVQVVPAMVALVTIVVGSISPKAAPEAIRPSYRASAAGLLVLAGVAAAVVLGRAGEPSSNETFTVLSVTATDGTSESLLEAGCAEVVLRIESHEAEPRAYEIWEVTDRTEHLVTTIGVTTDETVQVPVTLRSPPSETHRLELRLVGEPDAYRWVRPCPA